MYNVKKYIETCLNSILAQTFQDFEVIIVDDCSTDKSLEVVQKFKDPRIKIYQQIKNSGESARNLGLINSRGKYIYFMDSDDAILPNTLETLYNAIEESNSDVVHMNSNFEAVQVDDTKPGVFSTQKKIIGNPQPRFLSENIYERIGKEYLQYGLQVMPWIKIQRRDLLMNNGIYFPEMHVGGDVLFFLAELLFARKTQVIDACLYLHRKSSTQTTSSPSKVLLKKGILALPAVISYLDEIFSKVKVSNELKIRCESFTLRSTFFGSYILRAYAGQLPISEINEIVDELVCKVGITSPDLTRILINALSESMIFASRLRRS